MESAVTGGTVGRLEGLDIGVIVVYFVVVIGVAIWVSQLLISNLHCCREVSTVS